LVGWQFEQTPISIPSVFGVKLAAHRSRSQTD
jgi:hypothetical protein